ncbi:MAG: hypothetical protein QM674_11545 [Burkholderiaceae bacterium]
MAKKAKRREQRHGCLDRRPNTRPALSSLVSQSRSPVAGFGACSHGSISSTAPGNFKSPWQNPEAADEGRLAAGREHRASAIRPDGFRSGPPRSFQIPALEFGDEEHGELAEHEDKGSSIRLHSTRALFVPGIPPRDSPVRVLQWTWKPRLLRSSKRLKSLNNGVPSL